MCHAPDMGKAVTKALAWLTLFALYMLFAGKASRAELSAAALVAVASSAFAVYVYQQGHRPMRLRAPFPYLFWRVGLALARDTVKAGGALFRAALGAPVKGVIQRQPFDTRDDSPEQVGRRALVILGLSIAPNGFVLEETGDSLLLHRLVPAAPEQDPEWPV